MNAVLNPQVRLDASNLIQALAGNTSMDKLGCQLSTAQWETLVHYLQPFSLAQGQTLIEQGASDRHVYFIESGMLSVHFEDDKGRIRLAMLGAGGVVGEGSFFSFMPRTATVQASSPCKLWCMTAIRFSELGNRHPGIALQLTISMAGILARRLLNKPKRIAIT